MERPNLKKRKRQLCADAQWCLENKDTVSLKKFVEHYRLTDRHYASSRYRTIVTKYLVNDKKRLLLEYNTWKQSEDSTRFWATIKKRMVQLDAHAGAADYVGDVGNEEVDRTRVVIDTVANENGNRLQLQAETSQEGSEEQTPTSSSFTGNEDYTESSSVDNEEAETDSEATAAAKTYHALKLHKMEISTSYLTFTKLKQPKYQVLDL